jgi:IS605 OrfB family transposase
MYPTAAQQAALRAHCGHARFGYNLGLEQRSWWQPGRRSISFAHQCRELTAARAQHQWLAEGSSVVQQQALKDLAQAFANFFQHPEHFGYPTFRRKTDEGGFRLVGLSFTIEQLSGRWASIHIPKVGRVGFRLSRPLPKGAKSCRVKCDHSGRWHVSFPGPQPPISRYPTGAAVGLDRGVAVAVATSDGDLLQAPKPTLGEQRRMRLLQRRLARQVSGSNRSIRTRLAVGRLKAKERDRRKDWIEKTSTRLVRANDVIVLEGLQVRQMTRSAKGIRERPGRNVRQKAGLNRAILAAGWGQLARRLREKAEASGVWLVEVPPAFTSQTCAACWSVRREHRESQAVFHCRECGYRANADVNAAIVIRERGIRMLAPAAGHAVAARGADRVAGASKREPTLAGPAA